MSERTPVRWDAGGLWRDPARVVSLDSVTSQVPCELLRYRTSGSFWEILRDRAITLLVTREYEHLVVALRSAASGPEVTHLCVPHPSGLAVDRRRGTAHVASTRNPNQLLELAPVSRLLPRGDAAGCDLPAGRLLPVRSSLLPGCLYLHDLAWIGGALHGNAVGHNAVVRFEPDGSWSRVWWPRCVERAGSPAFDRNLLQLNSIAAGPDLARSFFTASTDRISARRPGHRNFAVDRRGVLFDGLSREPVSRGLTRPHSARLHRGRVWLDDSGYGRLGLVRAGEFTPVAELPGWTRGLCFCKDVAFVGTSRILPRFAHYAPGLDERRCACGVHAVDVRSGKVLGSLTWPRGNQVFAVDWVPASAATGLPFDCGRPDRRGVRLFYMFDHRPSRKGRP